MFGLSIIIISMHYSACLNRQADDIHIVQTDYPRLCSPGGGGDSDAYFLVILRHEFLNLRGKGGRTNLIPSKSADAYQSNGLIKSLSQFFLGYFRYNSYVP